MHTHNWIIDYRSPNRANMYRVKEIIVSTSSRYQEILIAETVDYGRGLFLDGIPQSSALDEHIYHESLIHPALISHDNPTNVFIGGGGEGSVLREVLKHNTVKKVLMVDIDEDLVNLSKKYLNNWHQGTFDDERVHIINEDARKYLATSQEMFDCIIIDMTDPLQESPSTPLFTHEFFTLAKTCLNPGGIFAMQAETTNFGEHVPHISIIKTLQQTFHYVIPYQTWIPFYCLSWGFIIASDQSLKERLNPDSILQILQQRNCLNLKFYDAETHAHMFSRPKYLRDALDDPHTGMIIRDDHLLIVE